ncbi:SDR family NAD(P)-dependent oxidoreductase [Paenibacillus thalictri]|uniref:SDR family NAD(P)-dependent oxidoreductase n=1 Tax=Paenibacillus thalictri TaxID=2527873 RepID=A0A4Q9DR11_9BACL|nr:SDR family NAD(P)-dependent oxidoreductase [Paenibacillus thalictri]TBL79039.1 SDR family NAD(P)-dependent oxidoreductase [Paenibacillus thalictri]
MAESKHILITGANRGLGYQLTLEAVSRGHMVYAGVRSLAAPSPLLDELERKYPGQIRKVELDAADMSSIRRAAEELGNLTPALDCVINNAAVLLEKEKTLEELDFDQLRMSFEINTFGPMYIIQQLLPLIYKGSDQTIINISSEAGTIINAFSTNYAYSMSKTALNMFSERLRHYVKDRGIEVYAVHPGWMKTDMGGEDAPAEPLDTARGVLNIIDKKVTITSKIAFINHLGKPMPL